MPEKKIKLNRPNLIQVRMQSEDYYKIQPYATNIGISNRNKLIRKLLRQALVIK